MTSYYLDEWSTKRVIYCIILILVNVVCELGQIIIRCDFLLARRVILSNV